MDTVVIQYSTKRLLEKLHKRTIKKYMNRKELKVFLCVDDDSVFRNSLTFHKKAGTDKQIQ